MLKAVLVAAALTLAIPAAPVLAQSNSQDDELSRICANVFNFLPAIVRKEAVTAVGNDAHVVIRPICTGLEMFTFGNAAGLGKTIGANPTLRRALEREGWRADDVTAINIHGNTVDLYVHRG